MLTSVAIRPWHMVLSQPVVTRSLCRAGCEDEVMDLGLALNKMNVILCD